MPVRSSFLFILVIATVGAGAGLLYSGLTSANSWLAGAIYGACIAASVSCVERGFLFGGLRARMRRWPNLLYIPATEVGALVLVCVGFAIGGLINQALRLDTDGLLDSMTPKPRVLVYAFVVSAVLVFMTRMRDLLGREMFGSLLVDRYHRPVEERRIFLFLDLVGSTTYARSHGALRTQEFLGAIFAALAEPVARHGGAVHDYVGDMAMVTWPEHKGLAGANCLCAVFAIIDVIERDAVAWKRRFGQVPSFRAALHGGSVITAEVGVDRHKITFFGDVVNTTARIEQLCRTLDAPVLISAELLEHLPALPASLRATSLGRHSPKEGEGPLAVVQIERASPAVPHPVPGRFRIRQSG